LFKSTVSALSQEQEDSSGLVALDTLRSFKRPDPPCDIGSHQSKRRKSSSLHSIRENVLTSNMPSLQRSFSETEATIKKALQRCEYLFYVWVSVHHTLIYIKKTNLMQSSSMFIGNCQIALHVSAAFCVHLQAH